MSGSVNSGYVSVPHRGAWLVYINGIEIPCVNIDVMYGVWAIPEAVFTFPPHELLHRLGNEDKVEVVAFYLDDLADPEKPEFKLLFEGEFTGWQYSSTPHGRMMAFNAIADISIFTQLYYFFLNNVDAVTDYVVTKGNIETSFSQAGAFYPFSLFKKGLILPASAKGSAAPPPDITAPSEIFYNAIRGVLDANLPAGRRAIPSVNFFARWARKRNFVNRFAALPMFEDDQSNLQAGVFPIIQSAQATTALQTIQQGLAQGVGNAGSMWDVLKEVYGHVLFEIAMLPTAPAARVRLKDNVILGTASTPPTSKALEAQEPIRLLNYFVKPQVFFGIAPMCNVVFPSMNTSYTYTENYSGQPTRTYVNDQFISSVLRTNTVAAAALTFGYPEEVHAILATKTGDGASAGAPGLTGKNMLLFPEEYYKGPVLHRMPIPAWFTHLKTREPSTTQTATTPPPTGNVTEVRALKNLMADYVAYEHQRSRYERRGGAVSMAWNPYIVPGFPCVVFDQKNSGFHTLGYVTNITQSLSVGSMTTSFNYSLGRTIPEMLELLKKEVDRTKQLWGCAPLEPVDGVRDIIQNFEKAEQFYNALFFQRQELKAGKKASFDFREVLAYENDDGSKTPITLAVTQPTVGSAAIQGTTTLTGGASTNVNTDPLAAYEPAEATTANTVTVNTTIGTGVVTTTPTITNYLTGAKNVVPSDSFEPAFNQYATAMKAIARPICTLLEYIRFLHGSRPIQELVEPGPDGYAQIEYGEQRFGNGVLYFKRIKRLKQGPFDTSGSPPDPEEVGVTVTPEGAKPYDGVVRGAEGAAQTRENWDRALLAYRSEMYDRKGPQQ